MNTFDLINLNKNYLTKEILVDYVNYYFFKLKKIYKLDYIYHRNSGQDACMSARNLKQSSAPF